MKKNDRKLLWFGGLILVGLVLFGLIDSGSLDISKLPGFAITPTAGYQYIDNPNSGYTQILTGNNANSFVCDEDECIVSATMVVDEGKAGEFAGLWSCYGQQDATLFESQGLCESGRRSDSITGRDGRLDNKGNQCTKQSCQEIEPPPVYQATWGFCPTNDPSFTNCNGAKSSVSLSSPQTVFSEEKLIKRTQTINFNPKAFDGSDITDKTLRINKYDGSCAPAIEDGDACIEGQKLCVPQTSCPSGYTFKSSSSFCSRGDNSLKGWQSNVCRSNNDNYDCQNQIDDNTLYRICDSTQQIGASTCGAFSSDLQQATGGQVCVVEEGVSKLKCPTSECSVGEKRGTTGETNYEQCISVGSTAQCTNLAEWSDVSCPSNENIQLIYDANSKSCVFPENLRCNPNEAICQSQGSREIQKCGQTTIGGISAYIWQPQTQCPGELLCDTKGTSANDDFCSATLGNTCELGEIQCKDSTSYLQCAKKPNEPNSYLQLRDLGDKTADSETCQNNQIVQKQGCKYDNPSCEEGFLCNENLNICEAVGCQFDSPGYECSEGTDSNGNLLEQCVNNRCEPTQSSFSATQQQFLDGATRCDGNSILGVKSYTPTDRGDELGSKTFYTFETKLDAPNTLNGECKQDFVCIEYLSNPVKAECQISAQFVGILAKNNYGVGELLNSINITLTNEVPNKANKLITAILREGDTEIAGTRISTRTDNLGKVNLNFDYAHPRTGDLSIEVIAGDPSTSPYKQTKNIKIAKTLDLVLNCPVQQFVGKSVDCTWKVYDVDNDQLVSGYDAQIVVTRGDSDLQYTPVGLDGLKFTADVSGGVLVRVSVDKEGFIGDEEDTLVTIEQIIQNQNLLVDNKNYESYSGSGIDTGTRQLKFIVVDSTGSEIEAQSMAIKVKTPSGQLETLTPTKSGLGTFTTSYNFQQAGNTYNLKTTTVFSDLSKESLINEYPLVTISGTTDEEKTTTIFIIGGIGLAITIVLILIIVLFVNRRKK